MTGSPYVQEGEVIMKMGACVRMESGGAWLRGLVVVATVLLMGIAADRAQAGEATEAMRATIGEVLRILADKDLKQPSKANERRQLLEKAVGERFDYQEMSRRSMGAQWQTVAEKDQQDFA